MQKQTRKNANAEKKSILEKSDTTQQKNPKTKFTERKHTHSGMAQPEPIVYEIFFTSTKY